MAPARRELKVSDNVTLPSLPPYSPELNWMENVWDYLRGNQLSHIIWDSYEAMVEAGAKAWRFLIEDPDRIRSIAHRHWATVHA
jgi:transposase